MCFIEFMCIRDAEQAAVTAAEAVATTGYVKDSILCERQRPAVKCAFGPNIG